MLDSCHGPVTRWDPASLLRPVDKDHEQSFALLFLNQALGKTLVDAVWEQATYRIAADGGANRLFDLGDDKYGKGLNGVIGDLDSLRDDVHQHYAGLGIPIIHDPDQYSTDFTKAMVHIRQHLQQQEDVIVFGGLGGRVDQGISVLHHLFRFQTSYDLGRVFLLSDEAVTFVLKKGRHEIRLRPTQQPEGTSTGLKGLGKHIGIIPLKCKAYITTKGLEWDVQDWETEMGGQVSTSNHVREDVAYIETTEDVLFTIDLDFAAA